MASHTAALQKSIDESKKWLEDELATLRTGRATPALLDSVQLEVYGTRMKLNQVASIAVSDARTLYVTPYDATQVKALEKAVTVANLGVSVGADERGVRVSFPELTAERRAQLIKLLNAKVEEARVAIRQRRSDAIAALEKEEKAGSATKDDVFKGKAEIQKIIDAANQTFEELAEKKERELSQ